MDFFKTYAREMLSVALTYIAWFLNTRLQPKARLVQGIRHASNMLINEPTLDADGKVIASTKLVKMATVSFVNTGRLPAMNVQVTFNWRPHHFNIWPNRHYTEQTAPDNRFTLLLGTLPPKDSIVVDMLAVAADLPLITSAFCDQCAVSYVPLAPQEVHPRWKLLIITWLIVSGFAANTYGLITLLQFVAARAP